jgi:hypothetical protein
MPSGSRRISNQTNSNPRWRLNGDRPTRILQHLMTLSKSNPTGETVGVLCRSSTETAIALAKRRFPLLSADGLYPHGVSRPISPDQIETAVQFLSLLTPTKTPRIGSGTLKHHAEDWGRRVGLCSYVSRGALTVAAVALGLVVETYPPWADMNPHVAIGVGLKALKQINAQARTTRRIHDQ